VALDYLRQYARQAPARLEPDTVEAVLKAGEDHAFANSLVYGDGREVVVVDSERRADDYHGPHAFAALRDVTGSQLALISRDPELAYADLSRAVFLDTETTGLSTGAGTYVFLVGAGYFEGDYFKVKQFFLKSPGDELPFLTALEDFLQRFSLLVTFNGKAFDWPLLESRYIRQRSFRRAPLEDPLHLDLLHPARRLWRRRLESCALLALEREILQIQRTGEDVPGWMIPSLYFHFLRSGDGSRLGGVFYHNLHDILSLASLTVHMDRVLADPMSGLVTDGLDFFCLGKLYERSGDSLYACDCYQEALRRPLSTSDRRESLARLATCQKRERRFDSALVTWERLLEEGGSSAVYGLVERAKYYEHVERDYMNALEDVQHALLLVQLNDSIEIDQKDLQHRRARLLNRVFNKRSWARAHA
jgi:uncharacterized protein YprB with RNaseH-like and TPR domain